MSYHAPINAAGLTCWLAGTATSVVSGLLAWFDPVAATNAETVQRVQQGGLGLAIVGLLTVAVNFLGSFTTQWFKDRAADRDERRDIRERDKKVEALTAEVERHHQKSNEYQLKMNQLQWELKQLTGKVKTNSSAIKAVAAGASSDEIPVATFDTQDHPTIPEPPKP